MIEAIQPILAEQNGAGQILVIVAVAVFAGLNVLMEKLKRKPEDEQARKRWPPVVFDDRRPPTEPPAPPGSPQRRPPAARPQGPQPSRRRAAPPRSLSQRPSPPPSLAGGVQPLVAGEAEVQRLVPAPAELAPAASEAASFQIRPAAPARPNAGAFLKPTPAELRRAVVLSEILGEPLAIRDFHEP
ncbi:MAG: hypothetical protein HRF43_17935 [Phycisphaerae bacterium]